MRLMLVMSAAQGRMHTRCSWEVCTAQLGCSVCSAFKIPKLGSSVFRSSTFRS